MEIKILFDRKRLDRTFLAGWGVSYLVMNNILFDTGEVSGCLFDNMENMSISIKDIRKVIISHDHFDHTGGLWKILRERPGIDLYICPGFSDSFKEKAKSLACNLIEVESFMKISDNLWTTGQMEKIYGRDYIAEQALFLDAEKGISILTGCAHPGIVEIVEKVKQYTKKDIYLVMGGFHLMDNHPRKVVDTGKQLKALGVQNVGPAHCSGEDTESIFEELYGKNCLDIRVGKTLDI